MYISVPWLFIVINWTTVHCHCITTSFFFFVLLSCQSTITKSYYLCCENAYCVVLKVKWRIVYCYYILLLILEQSSFFLNVKHFLEFMKHFFFFFCWEQCSLRPFLSFFLFLLKMAPRTPEELKSKQVKRFETQTHRLIL